MPGPELVDFHGEFARKFDFKMPIHPRHLAQMINPYQGYLGAMQKHFRFEELVQVYKIQAVASLERSTGRDLLAEELSCLSFWMAHSDKSSLNYEDFRELLVGFRFNLPTVADFRQEFMTLLHKDAGHGELTLVHTKEVGLLDEDENAEKHLVNVFRFDLARRIFLERGL